MLFFGPNPQSPMQLRATHTLANIWELISSQTGKPIVAEGIQVEGLGMEAASSTRFKPRRIKRGPQIAAAHYFEA